MTDADAPADRSHDFWLGPSGKPPSTKEINNMADRIVPPEGNADAPALLSPTQRDLLHICQAVDTEVAITPWFREICTNALHQLAHALAERNEAVAAATMIQKELDTAKEIIEDKVGERNAAVEENAKLRADLVEAKRVFNEHTGAVSDWMVEMAEALRLPCDASAKTINAALTQAQAQITALVEAGNQLRRCILDPDQRSYVRRAWDAWEAALPRPTEPT